MNVAEMMTRLAAVLNEFDDVGDENVQDTLRIARKRMSKINPEMTLTAKSDLGGVKRSIGDMAADAVYASGGEYEQAEAARRAILARLNDVF